MNDEAKRKAKLFGWAALVLLLFVVFCWEMVVS